MDSDEYSGSDGLKISQAYTNYLKKRDQFLAKARQYKYERKRYKQSVIHSNLFGYEPNEISENELLKERFLHTKIYQESFDITKFDNRRDSMYENFNGKSKRIRIIRELYEPERVEHEKPRAVGQSWFLRFSNLSKFVQVARMTILKLRLEKRLNILKRLTPEIVEELERDTNVDCTAEEFE